MPSSDRPTPRWSPTDRSSPDPWRACGTARGWDGGEAAARPADWETHEAPFSARPLSACFGLKEVRRSIVPARGWARPCPRTGCAPSAPRTLAARIAGARPTKEIYEHRPPCFSSERNRGRRGRDVAALYANPAIRSRADLCADRAPPRRIGAAAAGMDPLHRFVVAALDLRIDRREIGL